MRSAGGGIRRSRRAPPGIVRRSIAARVIDHLAANLFRSDARTLDPGQTVELIEAPDRQAEVRAALRWIKARLVLDQMRPGEVALVARSVPTYRPHILQIASEFGLPILLVDGLPLRQNPAIASLLDLLRLALPGADGQPSLSLRLVIEAWRSPYFDWQAAPVEGASEPIGIEAGDADALYTAARWGRVIGGQAQWEEALSRLAARLAGEKGNDDERGVPPGMPPDLRPRRYWGRCAVSSFASSRPRTDRCATLSPGWSRSSARTRARLAIPCASRRANLAGSYQQRPAWPGGNCDSDVVPCAASRTSCAGWSRRAIKSALRWRLSRHSHVVPAQRAGAHAQRPARAALGPRADPDRPWIEPFVPIVHHRHLPGAGFDAPHIELHVAIGSKPDGATSRITRLQLQPVPRWMRPPPRRHGPPAAPPSNCP